MAAQGLISAQDLDLWLLTDDVDEAVRHIDAAYDARQDGLPIATGEEHPGGVAEEPHRS